MDKVPKCVIFGAGGHAKVVIDALLTGNSAVIDCIIDADEKRWGTTLWDIPIVGGENLICTLVEKGITHFVVGVGTVGEDTNRVRLYNLAIQCGLIPLTVIHKKAVCSPKAAIGSGTVVFAGAIINPDCIIGNNVIVNTSSVIEHDCRIDDHVHIATGAKVAGNVSIGASAMIGAGAVIKQGICIGDHALIGAGSVVITDVDPGTTVIGVPARQL